MNILPDQIPITNASQQSFAQLKAPQPLDVQVNLPALIIETAQDYINSVLDSTEINEDDNSLNELTSLVETYETLINSNKQLSYFRNHFVRVKDSIKEQNQGVEEVTISNIDTFQDRQYGLRLFSELLEIPDNNNNNQSQYQDPSIIFLKNAAFVLKNPTEPLPDENNNDDDLEMEGGTIDLKCPITLQIFKDPYISTKCNHTFDKDAILTTFGNNGQICPIPGCPTRLTAKDFQIDKLMNLRVKSFIKQEKSHKRNENYDRV